MKLVEMARTFSLKREGPLHNWHFNLLRTFSVMNDDPASINMLKMTWTYGNYDWHKRTGKVKGTAGTRA